MDSLLKFNQIIHRCFQDISSQITECKKQIAITQQVIQELELSETVSSPKELGKLIHDKNELLIDNYILITQQMNLIKHYYTLSKMMQRNKNSKLPLLKMKKIDIQNLLDIISYYEERNQHQISNLLRQYLPLEPFSSLKQQQQPNSNQTHNS